MQAQSCSKSGFHLAPRVKRIETGMESTSIQVRSPATLLQKSRMEAADWNGVSKKEVTLHGCPISLRCRQFPPPSSYSAFSLCYLNIYKIGKRLCNTFYIGSVYNKIQKGTREKKWQVQCPHLKEPYYQVGEKRDLYS